ncbi:FAM219A [Branchiostoma lanceolatum]|uniref:FAM219A protein n=1 Tax=Branchiostoma lanceolatum TaxID=7740 RepID=A0A8K0EM39_BRALA|nr:FAM219A [Branchiostoma lanceolatum]
MSSETPESSSGSSSINSSPSKHAVSNGMGHKGLPPIKVNIRPSQLQKKIEKQREISRRVQQSSHVLPVPVSPINEQPKKSLILPITRYILAVPHERSSLSSEMDHRRAEQRPLVEIDTDSEDEFEVPSTASKINGDLKKQLLKDGFRLDEIPDDEDLDLIPPRPMNERCVCCHTQVGCSIQ